MLCAAWQRTYWLLQDIPATSPDRLAVIALRVRLLAELERRDPDGLVRWLHTQTRAGSDPGRYLAADHRLHHRLDHSTERATPTTPAGRMARFNGMKQGIAVWVWTIAITIAP